MRVSVRSASPVYSLDVVGFINVVEFFFSSCRVYNRYIARCTLHLAFLNQPCII